MTISTATCSVTTQGNASATIFNFGFLIPYQADGVTPAALVFLTDTTGAETILTLGVDYSITGVGVGAGGAVTYPLIGSPLAAGHYITIERALANVQDSSFPNFDFLPQTVESMGDRLIQCIQQIAQQLTENFLVPCTVAQLPAVVLNRGVRGFVTDATALTFGSIVAGSGSTFTPVWCDGANWRIG